MRRSYYAHFEQYGPGHESGSRAIFLYNLIMPNLNELITTIKKSHKTLFILCGFPYSGKSYVANKILQRTDVAFVSIDDIFHAHGFDWDSNILPDTKEWEQIFNESYEQTKSALTDGKSVLYDSTNQTVTSRNKLREIARSVGAYTKVVYIKSLVDKVWKRWEENQKNLDRSVVSKELIQTTLDMFEEPAESEDVIIVNN